MPVKKYKGKEYVVHSPASKKQEMILSNTAQVLVIGGAMGGGKTYLQQMIGLQYIDDPNTSIVTFRRTNDEITGQGGVWDTAYDIYMNIHPLIRPTPIQSRKRFNFPSGASSVYKGMELVKDAKKNQGLQFTLCNFDEGTLFEWEQIEYLFQRMRSKSKYKSRIVISTNPDPDHKIAELIDWYLDEDGFPDPEKEGVIRFFIRRDGDFIWGDTRDELGERFDIPEDQRDVKILSFSFIGCTIYDNPPNLENNPEYVAFLEGMNEVDKARNLYGNWYARSEGSKLWKRQWIRGEDGERVRSIRDIPENLTWHRGWDKGYTIPSDNNKSPDYTACSPKIAKDSIGMYWLVGDYNIDCLDDDQRPLKENQRIYGQFRKLSGERDSVILSQATYDGNDCKVVLTKDSGAGMTDHGYTKARLVEGGIHIIEDTSPKNTQDKKVKDWLPFCNACEIGMVYIVEETFPKATLEHIYKTWESFTGEKSTKTRKDDLVDAMALGFNAAAKGRNTKLVTRNQQQRDTLSSDFLSSRRNRILKRRR